MVGLDEPVGVADGHGDQMHGPPGKAQADGGAVAAGNARADAGAAAMAVGGARPAVLSHGRRLVPW
jgi:hypothetical protein